MKNYELVLLLHPQLSKEDHEKLIADINGLITQNGGKVLDTDDMGLMSLAHQITKAKLMQAYFVSYHLELPGDKIQSLKATFAIMKGLVRFSFFAMKAGEKLVSFAEINKTWEPKEDKKPKEVVVKKGFMNDKEHLGYINWKSVNFLRHYMTRFGDIKPRAFMGNRVTHQKKIRIAIIRARELGVLGYSS